MSMWGWIALGFVAILIGGFALPLVLSLKVTRRRTGRSYLQRRLRVMGWGNPYDPDTRACLDELVSMADFGTRFGATGSRIAQNAEFVRSLDALADVLLLWRRNPNDPMFASHGGAPSSYRTIFEKYGIR
jgi:hypothetical protein